MANSGSSSQYRSVLRGLCRFASVAECEGEHDGDEDRRAALDWLRQVAGPPA